MEKSEDLQSRTRLQLLRQSSTECEYLTCEPGESQHVEVSELTMQTATRFGRNSNGFCRGSARPW